MERSRNLHNFDLPKWGGQNSWESMNANIVSAAAAVRDDESSDSGDDNQMASWGKPTQKKLMSKASSSSPPPTILPEKKSARPKRNLNKKEEIPGKKFSIQLSRKEIEEDFIAMTGKKPPRKPNRRPKSVQSKLDALSPGLWLSEVHPNRYKVNEDEQP